MQADPSASSHRFGRREPGCSRRRRAGSSAAGGGGTTGPTA